jgi:hypothetical protein
MLLDANEPTAEVDNDVPQTNPVLQHAPLPEPENSVDGGAEKIKRNADIYEEHVNAIRNFIYSDAYACQFTNSV